MAAATTDAPPSFAPPAAPAVPRRPLRSYLPSFDLRPAFVVARREFAGYFATPVATVFIVVFLALAGVLTFGVGNFFARGQADLVAFFSFLPWLLLLFVPALTMRLWAEERRLGTIELLLTLPVAPWQAVLGKFLAAWAFCAVAIALTFPFWITVNILGSPDNGVILSGYIGSLSPASTCSVPPARVWRFCSVRSTRARGTTRSASMLTPTARPAAAVTPSAEAARRFRLECSTTFFFVLDLPLMVGINPPCGGRGRPRSQTGRRR